ncbi:RagB/SusD family nutrient uptake outer membrane protein [Longitalea arenae]|uniref:RagB/SusD family nutrient uptake outer membrane protein n=1 Tax=Longitalea arenae TaxID=2812558 RepID=UPI001967E3FC|nr:RagB/SusD family nutrient uptake outer membrane protein [Longitalea arenae]
MKKGNKLNVSKINLFERINIGIGKHNGWYFVCFLLMIYIQQTSCKKFLEIKPPITSTTSDNVYDNDATAAATLIGIFTKLSQTSGESLISVRSGLSSDELELHGGSTNANKNLVKFYLNALTPEANQTYWETFFKYLHTVNTAIEGLSNSNSLTPNIKEHLLGEAKFMRALFYFYLVNYYGDVPLALSSDYRINNTLERTPISHVYFQIINDLEDAKKLLSDEYLDLSNFKSTTERVRPTKWAAIALLSRVYLYISDWANAELQATEIINSTKFELLPLNDVFLKNSKEAILQLQPVNTGYNTVEGRIFILPTTGPTSSNSNYPVYLSSNLLNAFESSDNRRNSWVNKVTVSSKDYYYPYKYKIGVFNSSITSVSHVKEYSTILRLGEQYLIRAEARAQLNRHSDALEDLNKIRTRAGLDPQLLSDKETLLAAIFQERQVELFTEWGHRWLDMKRTNRVDSIMSKVTSDKGGEWSINWSLYPLPLYDIQQNERLIQNPGY